MAQQRARVLPALLVAAALCAALGRWSSGAGQEALVGGQPPLRRVRGARHPRRGLLDSVSDLQSLQDAMKDPKKLEELKKSVDEVMSDPAKQKALEDYNSKMQAAVQELRADPEMKEFFEDVDKDGLEAMKKYENDERILRKFSMAAGGPGGVPGMPGIPSIGAAAPARPAFKPGDEVIIKGLSRAPELNGKKAMVVPPTSEEKKTLEGTDRLIVRLMDTGDQFAVRPDNLMTTAQEVDELMSNSLEDVAVQHPALQAEAARLRESGKLEAVQEDPELKPIFEDIKKNGMAALQKYWNDERIMTKISKAMAQ